LSDEVGWADLFAAGSVFDLDVCQWDRMGSLRATDLGIDNTSEVKRSFTWGHVKLLPDEYIRPVRKLLTKAKSAMDLYTVPFPLIPGARFVPANSKKELENELRELQVQLEEELRKFEAGYDAAVVAHRPTLEAGFREAAKTPQDAESSIARLPSLYPTAQQARAKFSITWQSYSLASPQDGTFDGNVLKEAAQVRNALSSMLSELRKELEQRAQEVTELIARGGKVTEKTYNSVRRLCDRIDRVTQTFGDPVLVRASRALREAVNAAAADSDGKEGILTAGIKAVTDELRGSVEASADLIAAKLKGGTRKLPKGL